MPHLSTLDQASISAPASTWRDRWPSPWIFVFMPLPYGVFLGYMQTPLPYLLRQLGYPVERIGAVESLVLLPMALYFLWSPLVDFWLRRRTWILILATLSGAMLFAALLLLAHRTQFAIWLLFAGFSINLMTTACSGGLLAHTQADAGRARAAAWMQGGMLAAQALGGAALMYFSRRLSLPLTGIIALLMVALPAAVALTIPEPPPHRGSRGLMDTGAAMLREVGETLFSWRSAPGILLLVSPVGTGAAQSLFAALARDYRVGEHGVLLLNGLLGGVLTMLGAFAAVLVPVDWDRRLCYASAGLAAAAAGTFLAFAPMRPAVYFFGVGAYMLATGLCYAFFLGVVMVTLGPAGRSASSRYTILVSLGNLPVVYMTRVEGWGYGIFGPRGVPALDAAGNLLVAVLFALWLLHRRGVDRPRTDRPHLEVEGPSPTAPPKSVLL